MANRLSPIHPGEILLEEFIEPAGLNQRQLGEALDVPVGRIRDIVRGKRGMTLDMAARLAVYFGTSPELWINLQARFDAKIAERELMPMIRKRVHSRTRAIA